MSDLSEEIDEEFLERNSLEESDSIDEDDIFASEEHEGNYRAFLNLVALQRISSLQW